MSFDNNIDFFLAREDLLRSFSEIIFQLKNATKKDNISINLVSKFTSNSNLIVFDNVSIEKLFKINKAINNQIFIIGKLSNKIITKLKNNYSSYEIIEEPFNFLKLVKKLKNIINQKNNLLSKIQSFKQFNYSFQLNTIFVGKTSLYLTDKENEIFKVLLENQNISLSKKQLLSKVWNYSADIDTHTLETHIYTLRQKINMKLNLKNIISHEDEGYRINIIT